MLVPAFSCNTCVSPSFECERNNIEQQQHCMTKKRNVGKDEFYKLVLDVGVVLWCEAKAFVDWLWFLPRHKA
jgi:hypothetical protein